MGRVQNVRSLFKVYKAKVDVPNDLEPSRTRLISTSLKHLGGGGGLQFS